MAGPALAAGALLTRGERIAWVGPETELAQQDTRGALEVDLAGRALLPGFCDAHLHLIQAALAGRALQLGGISQREELLDAVRARAQGTPPGSWILGHGWDRQRLPGDRPPSPRLLDRATRDHPVFLSSRCLHAAWLNSAAVDAVLALPRLPAQCRLVRREGAPSGLVLEDILRLRALLCPEPSPAERREALPTFFERLWSCGITAVHNNEPPEDLAIIRDLLQSAEPARVRVLHNPVFDGPEALAGGAACFATRVPGWLTTGGAKIFLDGSFGAMSAALEHPYTGSEARGELLLEDAELRAWLSEAASLGVSAVFHAIGDRALAQALRGLAAQRWPRGARHRLEHLQVAPPRAFEGPLPQDLVCSCQPSHMAGDRPFAQARLRHPETSRWLYPLRSLARRGLLVFGSDAPVEHPDPWRGIQAAVTRLGAPGIEPWNPQERVDLSLALSAHTCNPAQLHRHGFTTGALVPGALADLVAIEPDPFTVDPGALGEARAALTVLGGRVVYERG